MIKIIVIFLNLLFIQSVFAEKPVGYLWYNLPKKEIIQKSKKKGVPFSKLNYQQKDAVMAFYTKEAWHKAMNDLTVTDMRNYIALQNYWTERATRTSRLFEKTMLYYPEFHYETTHPTNNLGVKVTDELREQKENLAISSLAKTHGLLYFYRGKNPYDQKEGPIIDDFAKTFGLKLLPVSVDGAIDPLFPQSRKDAGHAKRLNIRYFPALILVNPITQQMKPVSFGLVTQDVLARQFYLVATNFAKGDL